MLTNRDFTRESLRCQEGKEKRQKKNSLALNGHVSTPPLRHRRLSWCHRRGDERASPRNKLVLIGKQTSPIYPPNLRVLEKEKGVKHISLFQPSQDHPLIINYSPGCGCYLRQVHTGIVGQHGERAVGMTRHEIIVCRTHIIRIMDDNVPDCCRLRMKYEPLIEYG